MLPLTFIAGIYGMNFDHDASPLNMPETKWYWGYPFAIALMLTVGIAIMWFFKSKGWILQGSDLPRRRRPPTEEPVHHRPRKKKRAPSAVD
jgi:hypothetical protein